MYSPNMTFNVSMDAHGLRSESPTENASASSRSASTKAENSIRVKNMSSSGSFALIGRGEILSGRTISSFQTSNAGMILSLAFLIRPKKELFEESSAFEPASGSPVWWLITAYASGTCPRSRHTMPPPVEWSTMGPPRSRFWAWTEYLGRSWVSPAKKPCSFEPNGSQNAAHLAATPSRWFFKVCSLPSSVILARYFVPICTSPLCF